jgi:deoxyhypusine synthase
MSSADVCRNFVCGIGKFFGESLNVLSTVRKAVGKSIGKSIETLRPQSSVSKIRSVVMEELARLQNTSSLAELEERLQLMSDTIEAIQKKMLELSGHGLGHEALVSAAMASVENVNRLNNEEKVILTNIFRQNVAIQKPELVDSAIGQT